MFQKGLRKIRKSVKKRAENNFSFFAITKKVEILRKVEMPTKIFPHTEYLYLTLAAETSALYPTPPPACIVGVPSSQALL